MTANPPPVPPTQPPPDRAEFPAEDGWPDYPGFGSPDDVLARMNLLDWISTQLGQNGIEPQVGDYLLATDGRILGYGPDLDELHRKIEEAEPGLLKHARVVGISIPPREY